MKNKIDSSRRNTPWDNKQEVTTIEDFVGEKYKENYKNKHPKLKDTNEAKIFNSIEIKRCRYCDNDNIKKNGFTKSGIQRYFCKNCKKEFTPTTNTIFDNHKIAVTEWIEFLLDLFNYGSTSLISKVNKNAINTTSYWLHKTFLVLKNWQDNVILSGNVYIDEMFYKVLKSDIETKEGKQLRGLSHNQYCIGIGYDGKNIIAIVEGLGKTSKDKTEKAFMSHIKQKSKLIHDDEKSHRRMVKKINLIDESYNSLWLKTKNDKDNPLRSINHQCDLIRQFLNTHSGFDRNDLQDYLNLYCFMNSKPRNKLKKVTILLEFALNTKVKLNYRKLFECKEKTE